MDSGDVAEEQGDFVYYDSMKFIDRTDEIVHANQNASQSEFAIGDGVEKDRSPNSISQQVSVLDKSIGKNTENSLQSGRSSNKQIHKKGIKRNKVSGIKTKTNEKKDTEEIRTERSNGQLHRSSTNSSPRIDEGTGKHKYRGSVRRDDGLHLQSKSNGTDVESKDSGSIIVKEDNQVLHKKTIISSCDSQIKIFQKFTEISSVTENSKVLAIGSWEQYNPIIPNQTNILLPIDSMTQYHLDHIETQQTLVNSSVEEYALKTNEEFDVVYMINTIHNLNTRDMELLIELSKTKKFFVIQPNYRRSTYRSSDYKVRTMENDVIISRFTVFDEVIEWSKLVCLYTKNYSENVCWTKLCSEGDYDLYVFMNRHPSNKSIATVENSKVNSYQILGHSVFQFSTKSRSKIVVDDDLVTELKTLMIGKDRTPETRTYMIGEARKKMKEYHCLDEYALPKLVNEVFWGGLKYENEVLVEGFKGEGVIFNDNLNLAKENTKLKKFEAPYVFFNYKTILALFLTWILVTELTGTTLGLLFSKNLILAVSILPSFAILAVFAVAFIWIYLRYRNKHLKDNLTTYKEYLKDNQPLNIKYESEKTITFDLKESSNELKSKLGEGNSITVSNEEEKPKDTKMYQYGIGISSYPPSGFKNTHNNAVTSLVNRVVSKNKFEPNSVEFEQFSTFALGEGIRELLPELFDKNDKPEEIIAMPFGEWLKAFPLNRQKQLTQAFEERKHKGNNIELTYDVFTKLELLCSYEEFGGTQIDKDPRNISGPKRAAIVRMAPWIKTFSNKIKSILHEKSDVLYPSGKNSLQIGEWYNTATNKYGDTLISETDFSRWDKTYSSLMIKLEMELYNIFLPKTKSGLGILSDLKKQDKPVKMYNVFGDRVVVSGSRRSGDPNTSIGNTILNMLSHMYAYKKVAGLTIRKDYAMAGMGDDNLMIIKNKFESVEKAVFVNRTKIEEVFQSLGLDPKLKFRVNEPYQAEFCSAIFVPVRIDGRKTFILAPKPGRWLSKIGFSAQKLGKKETPQSRMLSVLLGPDRKSVV